MTRAARRAPLLVLALVAAAQCTPPQTARNVSVCGTSFCIGATPWSMYGATVYNPGLTPYLSGLKNPSGTVALVEQAHLNTIRITNFIATNGAVSTVAYDATSWERVDAMIAAAGAAGLHVEISLGDYRKLLWNNCRNPYTASWSTFLKFVANRVNTVTGVTYKYDSTIAFVSIAGEPLQVGTYTFVASSTGKQCTISYSTSTLTNFYKTTTTLWKRQLPPVLVDSGGLSYIDLSDSGIDWQAIFSLPTNDFCDIKTYGGMLDWSPNAVTFCRSIGKPIVDEEFGYKQNVGDAVRADLFTHQFTTLRTSHFAGTVFWNVGYEVATTSYEVSPSTPLTFAAVQSHAP